MNNKSNFVFFGTPEVASFTLDILKQAGFLPSLIVTSPDRPAGRKMLITPPPVKIWAEKNNIPYIQPEKLKEEEILEILKKENSDLFLVIAYGKIIPENIINIPKLGSINIHYSILPKYRGASPVESAILAGDTETGISIQKMAYKMDTGPIIAEEKIDILPDEKNFELRERLIKKGGELLAKILPDIFAGKEITQITQDESQATYCKKIKKEDGLIDIENEAPDVLYNKFRAYYHWPRIFFFQNGKRIIITDAMLEDEKFIIKKVLPEGGREITWQEFNRN